MTQSNPFSDSEYKIVFASLILIFSFIATVCSTLILYLIYKMKVRNGHILLIETMSWFQLIYDTSLFFGSVHVGTTGSNTLYNAASFLQLTSGISGALVSNVIGFVALYVVRNIQFIDI